jgi:hypothetical protein
VRGRGDERPGREGEQAADQHRDPAGEVGEPADEREHADVAEEEHTDDRRGATEFVGREPDAGHDVG